MRRVVRFINPILMIKDLFLFLIIFIPIKGHCQNALHVDSTSFNNILGLDREQVYKAIDGKAWGGIIIGYVEPSDIPIMTWSFSVLKVNQEKIFTLVEILNDNDPEKENRFITRDQILISSSNPDHIVDIGCKVNGEGLYPNGRYMGLYLYQGKKTYSDIIKAWELDFENGKITEITTEGMECDPSFYSVPLDKDI